MSTNAFASDWAAGELEQAVRGRHAVRQYTDEPISAEDRAALEREVAACNELGNLHMALVWDEPEAFDSALAHYGKFTGVRNYLVVAFGHGAMQGVQHKSKATADVCSPADGPEWFRRGVEWALLAPTAVDQQKFRIELTEGTDGAKPQAAVRDLGGSYSKVDQGIVSLHFELGAGADNFVWANI